MKKRRLLTCKFCGHIWLSKTDPKVCTNCHNDWRKKSLIERLKDEENEYKAKN